MTDFKEIKQLFNITENLGYSATELAVLKKVCNNIPSVLKEYYRQLGKVKELNKTQNTLVTPNNLRLSKNSDYLIFYTENQHACVWGIKFEDLQTANPPVYMSYDENKWQKETDSLSEFLNVMANLQAVFSFPFSSEEFITINNEALKTIQQHFKKRNFSISKWIETDFYGNHNNDVIMVQKNNENYDLLFASNNEQQFITMNAVLEKLV